MRTERSRRWRRRSGGDARPEIVVLPVSSLPPPPPPPMGVVDLEPVVVAAGPRRRRGGRLHLFVGLVTSLALLVAGIAAAVTFAEPPPDARDALRTAQDFVEGADSFEFEMVETARVVTGDDDGSGSDSTTRSASSGTVAAPTRWRMVSDLDDSLGVDAEQFEMVRVGSTIFVTSGIFEEEPAGPTWTAAPATGLALRIDEMVDLFEQMDGATGPFIGAGESDAALLNLVLVAHAFDNRTEPSSLAEVIGHAEEPSLVEELEDGGVRLAAHIPVIEELADLADDPIRLELELDLDDARVPTRFELTAEVGSASGGVEVTFSKWGADLRVDAPAEDDIDRTPWVSEEALEDLDADLLLAPTEVPEDLALMSVDVYEDEEAPFFDCVSLDLEYASDFLPDLVPEDLDELSPEDFEELYADMPTVSLSVTLPRCARAWDDSPFDLELGGLPARGGEGFWDVEVGNAVVTIDTTLDEAAAGALVASMRPTTVDELVAAIAPDAGAAASANPLAW